MMKVFVLNLDRDRERLEAVDKQLRRLGVEYERIPAVYGKSLSTAEKNSKVNRFRWWCAVGRPITDGELGCALSHATAYRKIVKEELPMACVLEDDVVLDDRIPLVLNGLSQMLQSAVSQVALLSNHSYPEGQVGDGHNGFRSPSGMVDLSLTAIESDMFAEGYVITSAAAKALLRANDPVITCCDWWGRWRKLGHIELYHAFPTVCSQDKSRYESHTAEGMICAVRNRSLLGWTGYKLKRLVGKLMDRMFVVATGR